ncbi:MAG: hypothetical protein U0X87_02425 [Anaerolineales bacterium]
MTFIRSGPFRQPEWDRIPVIHGLAVSPAEDQLKALGAASASSGGVALLCGRRHRSADVGSGVSINPHETIDVTMDLLRNARAELTHRQR